MALEYADKVIISLYIPAVLRDAILAKKPPGMSRNGFLVFLLQHGLDAIDQEKGLKNATSTPHNHHRRAETAVSVDE